MLGQSEVFDNGSSGDTSEDLMPEIENSRKSDLSEQQGRNNNMHLQDKDYHGLWSNSSRCTFYMLLIQILFSFFIYDKIIDGVNNLHIIGVT